MKTYSSLALVALVAVLPASTRAQETASDTLLTVNHYLDWEQVSDPQLSPDGSQIIYTRTWVNRLQDSWESALWIMNADGSKARFLTGCEMSIINRFPLGKISDVVTNKKACHGL